MSCACRRPEADTVRDGTPAESRVASAGRPTNPLEPVPSLIDGEPILGVARPAARDGRHDDARTPRGRNLRVRVQWADRRSRAPPRPPVAPPRLGDLPDDHPRRAPDQRTGRRPVLDRDGSRRGDRRWCGVAGRTPDDRAARDPAAGRRGGRRSRRVRSLRRRGGPHAARPPPRGLAGRSLRPPLGGREPPDRARWRLRLSDRNARHERNGRRGMSRGDARRRKGERTLQTIDPGDDLGSVAPDPGMAVPASRVVDDNSGATLGGVARHGPLSLARDRRWCGGRRAGAWCALRFVVARSRRDRD